MAKDFYDCAKNNGKVVSKKNKDGQTIKLCYDKEGNSHLKKNFKKKRSRKNKSNKKHFEAASLESLQQLVAHFNNNKNK